MIVTIAKHVPGRFVTQLLPPQYDLRITYKACITVGHIKQHLRYT